MIVIDASGVREHRFAEPDPKLCLFEFVYFAATRHVALRPQRARGAPAHGRGARAPGAGRGRHGDARSPSRASPPRRASRAQSGIPYGDGLVKNRYVGRTFIQPSQQLRGGGRAHEAEPAAREHPRQAARRRRRLDRARHHDAPGRRDAARGRRGRGALPRVVAAVPLAVLLRHGHRAALGAARRRPVGRRDRRLPQRRLARLPRARSPHARHGRAGRRVLHRLPLRATTRCRCPSCAGLQARARTGAAGPPEPARRHRPDDGPGGRRDGRRPDDASRRRHQGDDAAHQSPDEPLTYADAGVDIAAGEKAVERIKEHVRSTFRPEVVGDIGGFGGLFALGRARRTPTRCSCRRPTASARSR